MSTTFLPEDYLAQKAERRTNIISLVLFVIVMLSVWFAFLWGNRRMKVVKAEEESITAQFVSAEAQIENMKKLEQQQDSMLDKAELAAALVERVPRSNLLGEITNRMPPRLSILMIDLESTEIKEPITTIEDGAVGSLNNASRMKTREELKEEIETVRPPRYRVDVSLVGVAATDIDVSNFMHALHDSELLSDVRLDYSEEQDFDGRDLRQFKIDMLISEDADVLLARPPMIRKNPNDPMSDELRFVHPDANGGPARNTPRTGGLED